MNRVCRVLWAATLAIACAAASPLQAQKLAATPPMGWNSWNHFRDKVDDATIRAQAEAMVASGMRDAGYRYVNIDDTWEGERDAQGNIQANKKFPDMKALADFVHSKGLKLGIYSSPGAKTCAKYEGSLGHEQQDANTYSAWGIDYLKYDLCGLREPMKTVSVDAAQQMAIDAYVKMRDALKATGRPIVYSFCQYGENSVWEWGPGAGANLWRTTGDISDRYVRMAEIGFAQAGLGRFAGPGHWNDPDMLEVGNGGMNIEEYRTHMSLWAILAAPLLAGNDLSTMTPETRALLTNHDVVAIDQDPAGKQGDRLFAEGPIEVWSRQLSGGETAIGIFNRHQTRLTAHIDFRKLGFSGVKAHDVWKDQHMGQLPAEYSVQIPAHGVVLLRVKK